MALSFLPQQRREPGVWGVQTSSPRPSWPPMGFCSSPPPGPPRLPDAPSEAGACREGSSL